MRKRKNFKKKNLFKVSNDCILGNDLAKKKNFKEYEIKKGEIGIILGENIGSQYFYVFVDGKYGYLHESFMKRIE